ncbi:3D domain-containing protein [Candidatus Falkowbacteria bacterium]|nr:3D domain-containing protein [Candidatus Falkowbacteria bacterium]
MLNINKLLVIGKLNSSAKTIISLILAVFCINMLMPQIAVAQTIAAEPVEVLFKSGTSNDLITLAYLAQQEVKIVKKMKVVTTAYSSEPAQTDDTPCITANGYDVCAANEENVVAANFLQFGTKVRIPSLYGSKIFYVYDRMNPRYNSRIDLWKKDKQTAITFGVKFVEIEIVK